MARTHEDIENYIVASGIPYEQVGIGTWILHDTDWQGAQIVVQHTEPLVVYRVKLFDLPNLPAQVEAALLRHLLRLNATEMLQGAYALEGNAVVAVEVMQDQGLDENEFLAAIDSMTLAIEEHRDDILGKLGHVMPAVAAA